MSAAVVVIGAGAVGLAVAVQLRRHEVSNVIVVDRNAAPGMGSTSRANGGVRAQFSTAINIVLARDTIADLRELDAANDGRVGFRSNGYLFLSGSEAGAAALLRSAALQRSLGVDVRTLGPADVAALAPFVRVDDLQAATYCADDGVIDPHGVTAALFETARNLRVTFRFDTTVTGMRRSGGRTRVACQEGTLDADVVVNAAGPHAGEVARLAGVDLPVRPIRSNLACTESAPFVPPGAPMCVDLDTGVLVRREGDGVIIGYTDTNSETCWDTSFDSSFLDAVATRIAHRFPALEHLQINPRKCWAGLYPETPDHHAVIDAPDAAPWFIQCAGFGGHGIMQSMAAGRAVAELVVNGRCASYDLSPLRLSRFAAGELLIETAVL